MINIKKAATLIILLALVFSICPAATAQEDEIRILINNQPLYTSTPPVVVDGRTLVPFRAIGEAMGCEVIWVAATQTANLKNETIIVSMQIGNRWGNSVKRAGDGKEKRFELDVPPMLVNGTTYIPARAFAEALDAIVGWDSVTRTVIIMYDTTLNYTGNKTVSTFAGDGERKNHDSNILANMSFVSPESIDIADDGTIYVADAGVIRRIKNGRSETIEMDPSYLTADTIRCYKNDVYILTNEFQNEQGVNYYGIVKLSGNSADGIFITEAAYSKIPDFTISDDGTIYVLQYNAGVNKNYIGRLNLNTQMVDTLVDVDAGIMTITTDNKGNLYLGNTVKGSIYRYNLNENRVTLFAGVDNSTKFVDGPNPFFFEPRKLKYADGSLYVLDYNVIRKVSINSSDTVINCETLAGKITAEMNPKTIDGKASETMFAPSYLMDFMVNGNTIIITDPKWAVLREIV